MDSQPERAIPQAISYSFGDFELHLGKWELSRLGQHVELDPRPFDVLVHLIQNRDRTVPSEELVSDVWGVTALGRSSVPTAILAVRRALSESPPAQGFIRTVPRRGYRFVGDVAVRYRAAARFQENSSPFVGRSAELRHLGRLKESAIRANPQLVFVRGAPGIGKTRLVEEFLAGKSSSEYLLLQGRCREDGDGSALQSWAPVFRALLSEVPSLSSHAAGSKAAPLLAQMIPELTWTSSLPRGPADTFHTRLGHFHAMAELLFRAAESIPVIIFHDDLHRADRASLLLLHTIMNHSPRGRLMIIAALRTSSETSDPSDPGSLAGLQAAARTVVLSPLSRAEATDLLTRLGNEPTRVALSQRILARTAGNPLFILHLAQLIAGRSPEEADLLSDTALPDGVTSVVLWQLAQLPPSARELLESAAVAGRRSNAHLLARICKLSLPAFESRLRPATRLGLVVVGRAGEVVFPHAIVRDAVYEQIPDARQVKLHRKFGAELINAAHGDLPSRAAEIAFHLSRSGQPETAYEAATYCVVAGRAAAARLAYEDAQRLLAQSVRLFDLSPETSPVDRAEILCELGEAQMRQGSRQKATRTLEQAVELARQLKRPDLLARTALAISPGFFSLEVGVVDSTLIFLLEEALQALGRDHVDMRAQVAARLAIALSFADSETRRAKLADEALSLAEVAGDSETTAHARSAEYAANWAPDAPAERLRSASTALKAAESAGASQLAVRFRLFRVTDLLQVGAIKEADKEIAAFTREVEHLKLQQGRWYISLFRAMRAHMRGRLAHARQLAEQFQREGSEAGDRNASLSATAMLGILMLEEGTFGAAIPMVEAMRREFPAIDDSWGAAAAYGCAENRLWEEALHRVASIDPLNVRRDVLWMATMSCLGIAAATLGRADRCREIIGMLRPAAGQSVVVGYSSIFLGPVDRALGAMYATLESWNEAEAHLKTALGTSQSQRSPLWTAHSLHYLGRFYAARAEPGDHDRATRFCSRAEEMAAHLDLKNLEINLGQLRGALSTHGRHRFALLPAQ